MKTTETNSNLKPVSETLRKPWKYIGYRGFSAFLDSDKNFLVFRKFGALNSRLLLYLQDRIVVAEKELEELDLHYAKEEVGDVNNGSFREEMIIERVRALERIHLLIKEYNELLLQNSTIRAWPEASKRNIQSVQNWLYNANHAIHDEEAAYITQSNDLVSLAPKPKSPLRQLFERFSYFRFARIWKSKQSKDVDWGLETTYYADDARVESFIRVLITVSGMVMLVAPLWILAVTHGRMRRLGIITGFVILFLALVTFTTTARPYENLAGAAAYAAVLVVFLQIAS